MKIGLECVKSSISYILDNCQNKRCVRTQICRKSCFNEKNTVPLHQKKKQDEPERAEAHHRGVE